MDQQESVVEIVERRALQWFSQIMRMSTRKLKERVRETKIGTDQIH